MLYFIYVPELSFVFLECVLYEYIYSALIIPSLLWWPRFHWPNSMKPGCSIIRECHFNWIVVKDSLLATSLLSLILPVVDISWVADPTWTKSAMALLSQHMLQIKDRMWYIWNLVNIFLHFILFNSIDNKARRYSLFSLKKTICL